MKELLRLAYRNFFRNTRRSLISGISVAIAIAVIIFAHSYLKGITRSIMDNVVQLVSGHVRITTREYERRERMLPLSEALEVTPDILRALNRGEIAAVGLRIKFGVMLGEGDQTIPALGYGVEPAVEKLILKLDKRVVQGGYLEDEGQTVILGRELARRLGKKVGDSLTIITRTAYDSPTGMNLVVKGIYATGLGGIDRAVFYMPLKKAREMLDLEGRATEIVMLLRDRDKAPAVARALRREFPDLSVTSYQENPLLQQVNVSESIFMVFYFIILLVACSTIANTMLMVVFERQREIGMLKALGMGSGPVIVMLIVESGLIGISGSLAGCLVGAFFSYWLKFHGIDLTLISSAASADIPFGPMVYLAPTPVIVLTAFLLGLLASIVVAYLAVRRVAKLDPARSLRTI
jgi:putative ABC transport system permease protein